MGKPTIQEQLTKAHNELELSTFLNKGVLQTNSEQKLRIAELEVENDALRKAESMLAATEEERDEAQLQVQDLEKYVAALEERLRLTEDMAAAAEGRAQKGDAAVERLSSIQRSLRRAGEATEAWKAKYETLLAAVNTSQRIFAEATPAREVDPRVLLSPLSTHTPSQPAWEEDKPPRSRSNSGKRRRILTSDGSSDEPDEKRTRQHRAGPGPSSVAARRRLRGRSRYEGSGDDSADENYASEVHNDDIPPRTLPRRERLPPAALQPSFSSPNVRRPKGPTRRAPATAPRRRVAERKATERRAAEPEVVVKSEPESDQDPLGGWDDEFLSPE